MRHCESVIIMLAKPLHEPLARAVDCGGPGHATQAREIEHAANFQEARHG